MEMGWQLFVLAIVLTVSSVSAAGKCKVCDSSVDAKCITDPSSFAAETDCAATKCFTSVDSSGNIKRGCVSDTVNCDGKSCKSCDAADGAAACNTETNLFWCKTCDSSNNGDCSYWKNENAIPNEFCGSDIKKCVMEVKTDKHTSRRCASKSDEVCSNEKTCKTCDTTSCNKGIFPENRLKCFQCDAENTKCATPTKYTSDILSLPCLFYEESDKCFEHGSSETAMSRGCLSDTSAYAKCSAESPKDKCKECVTDGCNVHEYKVEPTAKCIQCKSDESKCAGTHTAEDATACTNKIEYWKPEGCYINKIEAGKIARGCIQDFDCASASTTCTSCATGNACNAQIDQYCIKCRSDDDPKCAEPLDKDTSKPVKCRNSTTTLDAGADAWQCYIEKWNDIIIRSCLSDTDSKTRKNCLDKEYKLCEVCNGDSCNIGKAPSSAHSFALESWILALSLLILKFF